MSRPYSPNEPARQPDYRKMYVEVRKLYDRIASQDSCITYLLVELRAAQKRIDKLEQHNAHIAANKVRAAYEGMEEVRELEQPRNLPQGEAGDQTVGHSAPNTGC
jgi:hypothetical protein